MTQEIENTAPKAPEEKPILPDGIGLTLEQAKMLISRDNGVVLSSDEPALMGITICNAYLGEMQKLHERHSKGLSKLMTEKTDAYVSGVNAVVSQLSESLTSASVEGIRKVFEDHASRLHAFKNTVTWTTAIIAVSALFNVAVFVLRGLR